MGQVVLLHMTGLPAARGCDCLLLVDEFLFHGIW